MMPEKVYRSSMFASMSLDTLHRLAHLPGHPVRGCAAWHFANIVVSLGKPNSMDSAKSHLVLASLVLNDPMPIILGYRAWLRDAPNAAGMLVWADRRWPRDRRIVSEIEILDAKDLEIAGIVADTIESLTPAIMAQTLGK